MSQSSSRAKALSFYGRLAGLAARILSPILRRAKWTRDDDPVRIEFDADAARPRPAADTERVLLLAENAGVLGYRFGLGYSPVGWKPYAHLVLARACTY